MCRTIVVELVVGVSLALFGWGAAHAQEENPDAAVIDTIMETLIAAQSFADEDEFRQRLLQVVHQGLGPEHPMTLQTMAIVAVQLYEAGKYQRLLEALSQELGPEHPMTLQTMAIVAVELYDDGYYDRARALQEEVLASRHRELGAEHPDTLKAMNNLAMTLETQGDLALARELQEQVLLIRRRVLGPEHPHTLTGMGNLAATLSEQGDLSGAQRLEEEVLVIRRRVLGTEHPETLRAMGNLAATLYAQGKLSRTRELQDDVLASSRRVLGAEHPNTLMAMNNLAVTLGAQGDLPGARELHEEVLARWRRVLGAEHPNTLMSMANLATIHRAQGNLSGARELEDEVLAMRCRVLGAEHPDTLQAKGNLAMTLAEQGDLSGARELEEEVLEARRQVLGAEHPGTLIAMGNLAVTLKDQGDLSAARELTEELLVTLRRVLGTEHRFTLITMGNLATILYAQGNPSGVRELNEEVLATLRRVLGAEHPDTLMAMANLAATFYAQGNLSGARDLNEEVLAIRRRLLGAEHPDTLDVLNNLGMTLKAQGNLSGSQEIMEKVLTSSRRELGVEHPDTLMIMQNLAATLQARGFLAAALGLLEEILKIRQAVFGSEHRPATIEEAKTFYMLGQIYRDNQEYERAAIFSRQALDALENQGARAADSEDLKSIFRFQYQDFYRHAVIASLDLGRADEALNILERSRARSFLTMLSERDLILAGIPAELDQKRRTISSRYDLTFRELYALRLKQDAEGIAAVLKKQRELRRERELVNAEIRRISPRVAELKDPQPLRLEEIRQVLDPDTLMLSYSVGDGRTDLFTLTRDGKLAVHQLPLGEEELRSQVERFDDQLHGAKWADLSMSRLNMATWLYQQLIEPAADRVEKSHRLLIIPDGPLHYLPFAALIRKSRVQSETEQDWQYLVEWKPLHTVLSATVYAELRKLRRDKSVAAGKASLQLAAFGDPAYPGLEPQKRGHRPPPQVRSAVDRGLFDELIPLPHSRREVTEIGRLYPQEAAQTYLGQAATEEQAKAVGKDVRILHFAAHGVLDPLTPLDSFLALSIPGESAEDRDNGLLQAWEVLERVRLDADLVVLSACQTALGPRRGGEGIISLSRAFQYAGARTVLATLWSVNDQSTAELMMRFHRNLRDGMPKDEALRAAQVELIRGPIDVVDENGEVVPEDYSAPYHWAAFQLIGDWQ